jgi:hypothetical protein
VSFNFEANYNMPQFPNDSFPGPLKRVQLTDKYPATKLDDDATPDDTIARKLKDNGDTENNEEDDETTIVPATEENENERKKRSLIDRTIFTRVGIYHMFEKRLDA